MQHNRSRPKKPTSHFAKVPYRVIDDPRFNLHTRALALIAFRDRSGDGCRQSQREMAKQLQCSYWMISRTIRDLMEWGYVERCVSPQDKRQWVYRVIPDKVVAHIPQPFCEIVAVADLQATENQNEFAQEESSKVRVGSKVAHARRRAYAVLKAFEKKWKEGTETDEDCEIAFNEVCEVLRVNEDREDQLYQYVMRLLQDVDWPPHLSLHKMF
jgi:DNA-binding transcriptional regulator GbsR (MarR family)